MEVSRKNLGGVLLIAMTTGALFTSCSPGKGPQEPWSAVNDKIIRDNKLKTRERAIPQTDVPVVLEPGPPHDAATLPKISLAPGVSATAYWSKGALTELVQMEKGATYPEQTLGEELITLVTEGSATCLTGGKKLELVKDAVLYLTEGMRRSLTAGPAGWKAIEVYSPVRADHLKLAGTPLPEGAKVGFPDQGVKPSLEPGVVYNLNEIQWTPVTDPEPGKPYKRSGANARLMWGKNVQLSIVRMDPLSRFPLHLHPEHQLMTVLRGATEHTAMDKNYEISLEKRSVVLLPGNMVHAAKLSEVGEDALDVFWPVRPDYTERAGKQKALYEQVIAPGTKPVQLAKGFTFTEGPTWIDGKLYFSDMYFANPAKGDWTGSPQRSRLIVMEPDGKWKVLSKGMQTNGTIVSPQGNLIVCDMFGHRVIEIDPASGRILRTVLDKVNGVPIDGPNDLVMDARGGLYITDPQFTPEAKKSQPGKQVYYVAPDGAAKVVIPAGEYAMPNGVEISPDGKTLYVVNTWFQPGENYVWAYDVEADGSLRNKRQFAVLNLTGDVLSAPDPKNRFDSRADGTAMDTEGRLYVSTLSGVQIFDKTGVYVGTIYCPQYPVSCTFGGKNGDILYMVGEKEVWSIQTKAKGFRHPAGRY